MQLQTPRKLIPITRSQSTRVLSAVGAMCAMTPALLNAASQAAELGNNAIHHLSRGVSKNSAHAASIPAISAPAGMRLRLTPTARPMRSSPTLLAFAI